MGRADWSRPTPGRGRHQPESVVGGIWGRKCDFGGCYMRCYALLLAYIAVDSYVDYLKGLLDVLGKEKGPVNPGLERLAEGEGFEPPEAFTSTVFKVAQASPYIEFLNPCMHILPLCGQMLKLGLYIVHVVFNHVHRLRLFRCHFVAIFGAGGAAAKAIPTNERVRLGLRNPPG